MELEDPLLTNYKFADDSTKDIRGSNILTNIPDYKQMVPYTFSYLENQNNCALSINDNQSRVLDLNPIEKACDKQSLPECSLSSDAMNEDSFIILSKNKGSQTKELTWVEKETNYLKMVTKIIKKCSTTQAFKSKINFLNQNINSNCITFTDKDFCERKKQQSKKSLKESEKRKKNGKRKEEKVKASKENLRINKKVPKEKDDKTKKTIDSTMKSNKQNAHALNSNNKEIKDYYTFNEFSKKEKKNKTKDTSKTRLSFQNLETNEDSMENFESLENFENYEIIRKDSDPHITLLYL